MRCLPGVWLMNWLGGFFYCKVFCRERCSRDWSCQFRRRRTSKTRSAQIASPERLWWSFVLPKDIFVGCSFFPDCYGPKAWQSIQVPEKQRRECDEMFKQWKSLKWPERKKETLPSNQERRYVTKTTRILKENMTFSKVVRWLGRRNENDKCW